MSEATRLPNAYLFEQMLPKKLPVPSSAPSRGTNSVSTSSRSVEVDRELPSSDGKTCFFGEEAVLFSLITLLLLLLTNWPITCGFSLTQEYKNSFENERSLTVVNDDEVEDSHDEDVDDDDDEEAVVHLPSVEQENEEKEGV
ncbi:hypothetical protein MIMGU_mgv1a015916mg [Erythranthe guttata]|uniref:Uncharacterized protein n=1 Tax=Erythranthe guttata TaxID=4155 RepID=A0A022QYT1_ERYGU|nr:hypothetical protein MIMGU_mgv1a015916mg [Erythranthe guttata]